MDRRTLRNKKSKTRNAKPYDRPNQTQQQNQQNQSIFGRVASKFKGILNPSWIFNVSQWMGTPEEDNSSDHQDSESGEEDEEQPQQTPAPTSHASKRPRLSLIDAPAPAPNFSEGTQTWLDTPSPSLFSPSSRLTSTVVNENSLIENKDQDQVIINGDDHSENSEGSASTSGCSSLVSSHKERSNCLPVPNRRLVQSPFDSLRSGFNRRDVTSRKDVLPADMSASRMSLWSGNRSFSPAAKLQQRSPVISHSNQPSFSVGAFMGSSKTSQQSDKKVASPFYQGKTSFGGASSTRRMPVSVAPYQVDRPARNQIKVRAKESEDSLEGMSSAAKRILMTLEKMSSPVTDAKKIPNTNRSPVDLSLYLMPPRLRSNVVSTPSSSKGPPIANISTISKLTTLKSCMRLQNTSRGDWLHETRDTQITTPVTESFQRTIQQQDSVPPPPLSPNKGPGKMRCKLTQKHQSSVRNEEYEQTPLPSIPLPISNLPIFKQVNPQTASQSSSKVTNENRKPSLEFEFSPPIEVQPALQPLLQSTFSTSKSDKPTAADKLPFTFSTPTEVDLPAPLPETSKDTAKPLSTLSSTAAKPSASSWSCQECWIQNPAHETKCLACETPQKTQTPNSSGFFAAKSLPTWACHECWTQNPECETKCLACETAKKGASAPPKAADSVGFGGNSLKKSTTWSCSSCWIQNPMKEVKCLACEAPNPSADKLSAGSSIPSISPLENCQGGGFKFTSKLVSSTPETSSPFIKAALSNEAKKPADQNTTPNGALKMSSGLSSSWECDTCSDKNPADQLKCLACETLRPSKRNNSGSKDSETFKFNSPMQNSPITFKFGSYSVPATTATASSTSSFGTLRGTLVLTTSASSIFGTGASLTSTSTEQSNTSNSQTVSGFKFGTPTAPVVDSSKSEVPVVDLVGKEDASLKPASIFGSMAKKTNEENVSSTKSVSISSNDKPNDIASIFTKPPSTSSDNNLELTKSTDSSNSKPTMSLFKFGAANQQPTENATSSMPVIDLKNKDSKNKQAEAFADAFKKAVSEGTTSSVFSTSSAPPSIGNTNFALPTSTEKKLSPFTSVKENSMPTLQQIVNSTPDSLQTSQSKDTPPGGFNFKAPTALGNSAFGGFSMPSDTSKTMSSPTKKPNVDNNKKSGSPFALGVTSSNSSPFTLTTTSSPASFSQVDASKTTKSPFGAINVSASSSAAPVFSFGAGSTTTSPFGAAPTSTASAFGTGQTSSAFGAAQTSTSAFGAGSTTTQAFGAGSTAKSAFGTSQASSAFGAGQTPTSAFGAGQTTTPAFGTASTSASSLQFPNKSLDAKPATQFSTATTNSGFNFGNVATATTTQSSAPSGGFSFFGATTTAAANPGLFTFGASSNTSQAPKSSGFSTAATSTTSVFGASAPTSSTGAFAFGAAKTEPVNSTPSNFAFGSGTTPSAPASTFTGFQAPSQPASNVFQFGSQPANNPAPAFGSAASGGFSFGSKSEAPSQVAPSFGAPSVQQSNMFGGTAPTFGGAAPAAASTPFVFGNTASSSGGSFSFGTPQQDTQNAGQFQAQQPQFNISTPPTFNFGATSTQSSQPFQFAASTAPAESSSTTGQRRIRKAVRRVRN